MLQEWSAQREWVKLAAEKDKWASFGHNWWGNTTADSTSHTLELSSSFREVYKNMGVLTGRGMVVRECYRELCQMITHRLPNETEFGAGFIITGQPGTGMS